MLHALAEQCCTFHQNVSKLLDDWFASRKQQLFFGLLGGENNVKLVKVNASNEIIFTALIQKFQFHIYVAGTK